MVGLGIWVWDSDGWECLGRLKLIMVRCGFCFLYGYLVGEWSSWVFDLGFLNVELIFSVGFCNLVFR